MDVRLYLASRIGFDTMNTAFYLHGNMDFSILSGDWKAY